MQHAWHDILEKLATAPDFYETTAMTYLYHVRLLELIHNHTCGRALDLGCGRQTYRPFLLEAGAVHYIGMDIVVGDIAPDLVASGAALPLKSSSINTILCTQVLEHVPKPWIVAREIERVLAPGGYLIVTVPFFYFLHGEPHDYYRYTTHGVAELFKDPGLVPVSAITVGGPIGMVSEYLQMAALIGAYTVRPLWPLYWKFNCLYNRAICAVDQATSSFTRLPINVMAVFKKLE